MLSHLYFFRNALFSKHAACRNPVSHLIARRLLARIFKRPTPYQLSIAENVRDLTTAFSLVYREYRKKGFCRSNGSKLYFNPFVLTPLAKTIVLNSGDVCRGTVTFIPDGESGLPIDELFPDIMSTLRARGMRLTECSMLSLDTAFFPKKRSLRSFRRLEAMFSLFSSGYTILRDAGETSHFVIAVNPRHVDIYRLIGYETIADVRRYDVVSAPAQMMIISMERIQQFLDDFDHGSFLNSVVPENLGSSPSYEDYRDVVRMRYPDLDENLQSLTNNKTFPAEDAEFDRPSIV